MILREEMSQKEGIKFFRLKTFVSEKIEFENSSSMFEFS